MSPDPVAVTSSAWQLAHHGTPRLPASGAHWPDWLIPSGAGQVISNREPGLIGLAAIFYRLIPSASVFDVFPASLSAAVVTSAAMATLALVFRRLCAARAALIAALFAGTATTTWAVSSSAAWPHGPDQLYLAIAILALASGRNAGAGVAFALAILTRPPLGFAALVMGLYASWYHRSVRPALTVGLFSAAGVGSFLWYSHEFWQGGLQSQYTQAVAGSNPIGQLFDFSGHGIADFCINIVGTLVSPGRGVLFGAPFLLVLVPGIVSAWRAAPHWVRSAAVAGLVYLVVELKTNRFSGGSEFWSYRYPLETLTLCAPLLLLAWRECTARTVRRRAAFLALGIFAIALQAAAAVCFRHADDSWWTTTDLAALVRDSPRTATPILLAGYIAAVVLYRRMTTAGESQQSVLARWLRKGT
jgi:hypothetical protein